MTSPFVFPVDEQLVANEEKKEWLYKVNPLINLQRVIIAESDFVAVANEMYVHLASQGIFQKISELRTEKDTVMDDRAGLKYSSQYRLVRMRVQSNDGVVQIHKERLDRFLKSITEILAVMKSIDQPLIRILISIGQNISTHIKLQEVLFYIAYLQTVELDELV